jgi:hypothetical protein
MDMHLIVDQSDPIGVEEIQENLLAIVFAFWSGTVTLDAAYLLELTCILDMTVGTGNLDTKSTYQ